MNQRDIPTEPLRKKSFTISEDAHAYIRLGTLVAILTSVAIASVWIWTIKCNGEQALREISELRQEIKPYMQKTDQLWWMTMHNSPSAANP